MISARNLSFSIGSFKLGPIDLDVSTGSYFVLLGPPGSGKSIFLECLCGLKRISAGKIFIHEKNVTRLEPRKRNIGYVPQDYALFPHLTVKDNITFALNKKKMSKNNINAKVSQTAHMLGITHLLERKIHGLSGGEKQRTALARAIIYEPQILLLDEPVCALDELTRQKVCLEIKNIQQQLNLTVIHVSHNQEEAFSVADSAAIIDQGKIIQTGTMNTLLEKPANEFTAAFMKYENIFTVISSIRSDKEAFNINDLGRIKLYSPLSEEDNKKICIRPENVKLMLRKDLPSDTINVIPVEVNLVRNFGRFVRIEAKGPIDIVAHISNSDFKELHNTGLENLAAVFAPEDICYLPDS